MHSGKGGGKITFASSVGLSLRACTSTMVQTIVVCKYIEQYTQIVNREFSE
jgi:hypothetical protein